MLEFEASPRARLGSWGLLGFWLLFAAFWVYQCMASPPGVLLYGWTAVAFGGLAFQLLRVRCLRAPLLRLGPQSLEVQRLLGRYDRHELHELSSASLLRRSTRATLVLRFRLSGRLRRFRGRRLCALDELNEPRSFLRELLARIPQAHVDRSIRRYLAGEPDEPMGSVQC